MIKKSCHEKFYTTNLVNKAVSLESPLGGFADFPSVPCAAKGASEASMISLAEMVYNIVKDDPEYKAAMKLAMNEIKDCPPNCVAVSKETSEKLSEAIQNKMKKQNYGPLSKSMTLLAIIECIERERGLK